MQIDTKLDFNLISLEQEETINLLLELTAPELEGERRRDPATLQVVLDRSGSMADGSLVSALQAIDSLLGRLSPEDRFGLVVFDDGVQVAVPAGRARRRPRRPRGAAPDLPRRDDQPRRRAPARHPGGAAGGRRGRRDPRPALRRARQPGGHRPRQPRRLRRPAPTATGSPPRRSASVSATTRTCWRRSPAAARATPPSPSRAMTPAATSPPRSTACWSEAFRRRASRCARGRRSARFASSTTCRSARSRAASWSSSAT